MKTNNLLRSILILLSFLFFAGVSEGQTVKDHFQRAMAAESAGNHSLAIAEFTTVLQLDPTFHWAYYNRGIAHWLNGSVELALLDYTKTIEIKPDHVGAYTNRGRIYLDRNELDKAFADLTKAIELNPLQPEALMNRGSVFMKRGMVAEALADYKRSAYLDPGSAITFRNLGNLYFRTDNWIDAIREWNRSVEIDPSVFLLHDHLTWAYLLAGNYDQVPISATRCINAQGVEEQRARSCTAIGYLGLLRAGKRAEAEEFLQQNPSKDNSRTNSSKLLDYFRGKISDKDLLDYFGSEKAKVLAARTYIGESQLIKGNISSALENFRVAEELGIKDINEYRLAQVELKRLSIK